MPLHADAARWWEDPDLHALRERIERRRAREARQSSLRRVSGQESSPREESSSRRAAPARPLRGVREVRGIAREPFASAHLQAPGADVVDPLPRVSRGVAGARRGSGDAGRVRRPRPRAIERIGPRPDMIAAWAVVLGVVLLVVAVLSAHS